MAFGQNYLNSAGDFSLRDYSHASRVFRTAGYENTPRFKFLFHVYFNINPAVLQSYKDLYSLSELRTLGLLVKTIALPKFKMATEVLNQYNRKRIVQKKIEYEPVTVEMHDDGGDLIRNMWYNYFSYYYKDPTQQYGSQPTTNGANGVNSSRAAGFDYNSRDIYAANRQVNDWGYVGEAYSDNNKSDSGKAPFFSDISIYGFDQHKFVQYVLINPLISSWEHDVYDYSEDAGIMKNTMSIQYETVKYYSGAIGDQRPDTNVEGFADPANYDTMPSSLSRPQGQASVVGQGSITNVGGGQRADLQAGGSMNGVGGVQQPNVAYSTPVNTVSPTNSTTNNGAVPQAQNTLPGQVVQQPNTIGGQSGIFPTPPVPPQSGP